MFLNGDELQMTTPRGEEMQDESFLVLFNAHHEAADVPAADAAVRRALGSSSSRRRSRTRDAGDRAGRAREEIEVESRSIVLLRRVRDLTGRPTGCS